VGEAAGGLRGSRVQIARSELSSRFRFSGRKPTAAGTDLLEHPAALWQQLERVSVTWPDDGKVAAVERGDPDRAVPLGQGDHGRM
jgi:hypothetical protein